MSVFDHLPRRIAQSGNRCCLVAAAFVIWSGSCFFVEASCGDHLHHAPRPSNSVREAASVLFGHEIPAKPCSGPACRSRPQVPNDVPPAPIHSSAPERWILGPTAESLKSSPLRIIRNVDVVFSLEDHRASLDRPPRSATGNLGADWTRDLRFRCQLVRLDVLNAMPRIGIRPQTSVDATNCFLGLSEVD